MSAFPKSSLVEAVSQFQESMSPIAKLASQIQESMSPAATQLPWVDESMSPIAALASQIQESMSPAATQLPWVDESMSPIAALASQIQESMSPAATQLPWVDESMSPIAALASQIQESMNPAATQLPWVDESMSPIAALASQIQESMNPAATQLPWVEHSKLSMADNDTFHMSQIVIDCVLDVRLPEKRTIEERREIRFRILCAYYNMFHTGKSHLLPNIRFKDLKIDQFEINAATIRLIRSGFLEGTITDSNESLFPNVRTISNRGIARVERKVIKSEDKETNVNICETNSKFRRYVKICFTNRAAMFVYNKVLDWLFHGYGHS